jgi:hypothetical protein
MTVRRIVFLAMTCAAASLMMVAMGAQGGGAAAAQGGGGGRRGGGAGAAASAVQPKGTLTPLKLDERGEGWMVKSYLDPKHLPLYNTAKQHLLDQKQVTSYSIANRPPEHRRGAVQHDLGRQQHATARPVADRRRAGLHLR